MILGFVFFVNVGLPAVVASIYLLQDRNMFYVPLLHLHPIYLEVVYFLSFFVF